MRPRATTRTRRTLASLATLAALASGALATAVPASAATVTVTATCSGVGGGVVVDDYDVTAGVGDIIFLANLTGVTLTIANKSGVTGAASVINGSGANLTVTSGSGSFDLQGAAGCNAFAAAVTFGPASTSALPPSVVQQFGKPASGTCEAAAPASLNWAGVPSGGWGNSWAQWMNGGNGGPVCSRMLVYSNNLGAWTVG